MNNYVKSVFIKYKFLILFFVFFGGLVVMTPVVLGINQDTEGWQVNKGNVKAISAVGTTTKLLLKNVSSAVSYFVPTNTEAELAAFLKVRPVNLEMGSCGDKVCDFYFGENQDTCPADCGIHPDRMFTWQFTGTYDPWNQKTVGGICGDGVCNPAVEDANTCPYDCTTGCCAIKGNLPIPNCNLYTSDERGGSNDPGYAKCIQDPGCTTVDAKGNSSFGSSYVYQVCGFNQDYICTKDVLKGNSSFSYDEYYEACNANPSCAWNGDKCITTNSYCQKNHSASTCVNNPKCEWDDERDTCVGKTKACWDNKTNSSCLANPNCAWVGQIDSPHCYNYCGDGVNNNITETSQTCPIEKRQFSPSISITETTYRQCGDNYCFAGWPSYENATNCPRDCASSSNGIIIPTNGCGDGICQATERKGQAGYCYVDCGDIGEGECIPFNDICSLLVGEEKYYTFSGCNATFLASYDLDLKRDECSYAKNRNECNRFGCYWDVINILEPCGDGHCNNPDKSGYISSEPTEDCNNCPGDCGYCPRTGFCEGSNFECSKKAYENTCESTSGCRWVTLN